VAESNANIGVKVGGDVSPLQRELKKGSNAVAQFSRNARKATTSMAKMGAGAAAAAAGGLTLLYNQQSKVIDNLAKTADALDVNIASLQALHHIAELNGVSQESMSKNLQRMEMRLGEAARKGGAAADALEDVGLTVENLKGLGADKQMEVLAASLAKVEDQTIKASIASDLFGRDGLKMLKVLKALENDGLKPVKSELDELGVSLNRIDAAKVEAANDALFRVSQAAAAAGQAFTVEMAPFIEAAANELIDLAKEAGGFGSVAKNTFQSSAKAVGFFADMVHGLQVVFKGAELVAVGFKAAVVSVFEVVSRAVSAFVDDAIGDVNFLIAQLNKIPKVSIGFVDTLSDSDFMTGVRSMGEAARNEVATLRSELHEMAMQEMPSQAVEGFLEAVTVKSNEAAKAAVSAAEAIREQKHAAAEEVVDGLPSSPEELEEPNAKIDSLKDRYDTVEQAEKEHLERMAIIGEEFDASKFASEGQWMSIREQAQMDHVDRMNSIRDKERTGALSIAKSMGDSLMSLAQGRSKKAFELGKKVARATAVVDGYKSAVAAWSAGMATGGPWAPVVAAAFTAASLAKTGALIRNINAQSFSGGGGQSNPGGSGAPAIPAQAQQAGTGAAGPTQGSSVALNIDPDAIITGRGLVDMLNEAVDNGANLRIIGAN